MHCTIFVRFVPFCTSIFASLNRQIFQINRHGLLRKKGLRWRKSHPSVHERRALATAWLSKLQSQLLTPHIPGDSTLALMPLLPFGSSILGVSLWWCVWSWPCQLCRFLTVLLWVIVWVLAALTPMSVDLAQWTMVPEKCRNNGRAMSRSFGCGWRLTVTENWRFNWIWTSDIYQAPHFGYQGLQIYTDLYYCFMFSKLH